MRRFVDNIRTLCTVLLISSDVNFTTDLSDFKNRKHIRVIVIHGPLVSEALLMCSNEHYLFDDILDSLPSFEDDSFKVLNKKFIQIHSVLTVSFNYYRIPRLPMCSSI